MKRLRKLNIGKWLRKTRLSSVIPGLTRNLGSGSRSKFGMTLKYLLPGRLVRKIPPEKRVYFYIGIGALIIVLSPLVLGELFFPKGSKAAWFDENYLYRQAIPVTSTEGSSQKNVFVSFALDTATLITAGKLQSSCQDLRLTDQGGNILKYHIGRVTACNNAATTVDFLLDSFPDGLSTYYVYYGNSQVRSADTGVLSVSAASAATITASGNEITDATRTTNTQGDGVTPPDSSYGIWQAATNLVTNGGFETNTTGWTSATATVSRSTAQSKFGTTSLLTTPTAQFGANYSAQVSVSPSTTYTASLWINRTSASDSITMYLFDQGNTNRASSGLSAVTGWQRVTVSYTTPSSGVTTLWIDLQDNSAVPADSWYLDGVQIEQSSIATPYIETNGGTAARSAGRVQASSSLINNKQSWVAMRVRIGATAAQQANQYFLHYYTSANERMGLLYSTTGYECFVITNGEYKPTTLITLNPAVGDMVTLIWRLDTTTGPRAACSVNGSAFTVGAPAAAASAINASTFDIGRTTDGNNIGNGTVLWTAAGTGTLTDADASTLNGYGNTDPTLAQLASLNGGIAKSTFLWTADTSADTQTTFSQGPARNYTIGSLATEEKSPSPVAYWAFDEGTGNVASSSASPKLPGAISGTYTAWVPESQCVIGKCLYFTTGAGVGSQIDLGNSTKLNPSLFTISAWVKYTDTSYGYNWIFSSARDCCTANNGINFYISNGKLGAQIWNSSGAGIASDSDVPVNRWVFVAVSYDGSTLKLYQNGVLINSANTTLGVGSPATYDAYLGTMAFSPGTYTLKGYLDEVKVYPFALSASQVKANYNARGGLNGQGNVLGATQNNVLSNGLVGYWKMDEASWSGAAGEVIDSSGNGNNGTSINGAEATPSAKFGNAGFFAGTDEYVSTPVSIGSAFSISLWFKQIGFLSNPSAFAKVLFGGNNNGCDLYDMGVNVAFLSLGSSELATLQPYIAGSWNHVVVTVDGTAGAMYVNGVLKKTSNSMSVSCTNKYIGGGSASRWFDGTIDETRVYNRALNSMEVSQLYNFAPGPVGYWNFEAGQGSVVNDVSTYGNNGVWNGTGSTHWGQGKYGKGGNFDGTSDYVSIFDSNSLDIASPITLSTWFKADYTSWPADVSLISKPIAGGSWGAPYASYLLYITSNGTSINFLIDVGGTQRTLAVTVPTLPRNKWFHVASVYDGVQQRTYLDGVLIGTRSQTGNIVTSSQPLVLGQSSSTSPNSYLDGQMDQTLIYNYARTPAQIISDMQAGAPGVTASGKNTIGYWDFDEGYGTTANNSGSQGVALRGTLTNMASPATAVSGWSNEGKFSKALSFDGTNDYVDMGDPTNGSLDFSATQDFTLSVWMNPSNATDVHRVLQKGFPYFASDIGYSLLYRGDQPGKPLEIQLNDGSVAPCDQIDSSGVGDISKKWSHFVVVMNRTTNKAYFYLNGKAVGSQTIQCTGSFVNTGTFKVGGNGGYFSGFIDEVKVYNYSLTARDVKTEYNHGSSLVLGSAGMNSSGVASNSASAVYCVPGDTTQACSPVGEWKFEEGQGRTVNDTSGGGVNGAFLVGSTNSIRWTNGKVGKGLSFSGLNQYVDFGIGAFGGRANGASAVTISAWAKSNSIPSARSRMFSTIINSTNTGFALSYNGTNVEVGGRSVTSDSFQTGTTPIPPLNQWHYFVGVLDYANDKIYVYVDGVLKSTTSVTFANPSFTFGTPVTSSDTISTSNPESWDGVLDQVRVYNYALSQAQVAYSYNQGKPVAYWDFDECEGPTAHEYYNSGVNGTITIGSGGTQTTVGTCNSTNTAAAWYNGRVGKYNSSLNFDGTDDFVDMGSVSTNFTTGFSVCAWTYFTNTASWSRIIDFSESGSTNDNILLARNSTSSDLTFEVYVGASSGGQVTATSAITNSTWMHLCATEDSSGNVVIYKNGASIKTGTTGVPANVTRATSYIAKSNWAWAGDGYFGGQIDDVQIYNYPLTAVQVKNVYNQNSAVRFGPSTGTP